MNLFSFLIRVGCFPKFFQDIQRQLILVFSHFELYPANSNIVERIDGNNVFIKDKTGYPICLQPWSQDMQVNRIIKNLKYDQFHLFKLT